MEFSKFPLPFFVSALFFRVCVSEEVSLRVFDRRKNNEYVAKKKGKKDLRDV